MSQDDVEMVDAAIIMNGTIQVRFTTDGTNSIGTSKVLNRRLPTTYTANIGTSQDTNGQATGTFVIPNGYRLLASETTSKVVTIDDTTRSQEIVFFVELLNPNLSATKTSTQSSVSLHPGDEITYTITLSNTGNEEALDTIIKDKVPANTELVSIADGGTIDANGVITWSIQTIASDSGSTSVSFTIRTLSLKDSGRWTVINDQATYNGIAINATSNEVTQGLLTFEKISNVPNLKEVLPESRIDYKIRVTNIGGADMSIIKVMDMIPNNTTYIDGSISEQGVMNQDILEFTIANLAPGESIEVGFSVNVKKDAKKGSTIANTAQVNGVDTNTVTHYIGSEEINLGGNDDIPGTGDNSNVMGLMVLLFVAGSIVIAFAKRRNVIDSQ